MSCGHKKILPEPGKTRCGEGFVPLGAGAFCGLWRGFQNRGERWADSGLVVLFAARGDAASSEVGAGRI